MSVGLGGSTQNIRLLTVAEFYLIIKSTYNYDVPTVYHDILLEQIMRVIQKQIQ